MVHLRQSTVIIHTPQDMQQRAFRLQAVLSALLPC